MVGGLKLLLKESSVAPVPPLGKALEGLNILPV